MSRWPWPGGDARAKAQFGAAIKRHDFHAAEVYGRDLLARHPRQPRVRIRLAHVLEHLGRPDEAHATIAGGVGRKLSSAISATIGQMYADFGIATELADAWRFIPRGMSAVCSIEHPNASISGVPLITKVVTLGSPKVTREIDFYTRLTRQSTELRALAPRLVDYRSVEGSPRHAVLTLEMIVGRRPSVLDVGLVRDGWIRLSRGSDELVRAGLMLHRSRWRDHARRTAARTLRRSVLYPESFAWIHTRRAGLDLFDAILLRLRTRRAAARAIAAAEHLRAFWFDHDLPNRVQPDHHYALVHGDFHEANLIVDEASGECRVIDWESASWGPPALDITSFAAGLSRVGFDHLEQAGLLSCDDLETAPLALRHPLAPVLLVVTLLTRWLGQRSVAQLDDAFDRTVAPALEWVSRWRPG